MKNIGRNDPCPCGSGKKYKKCCALKSPLQKRQFTNMLSSQGKSSLSKLSGMVSQALGSKTPSNASDAQEGSLKNRVSQKDSSENKQEKAQPKEDSPKE